MLCYVGLQETNFLFKKNTIIKINVIPWLWNIYPYVFIVHQLLWKCQAFDNNMHCFDAKEIGKYQNTKQYEHT